MVLKLKFASFCSPLDNAFAWVLYMTVHYTESSGLCNVLVFFPPSNIYGPWDEAVVQSTDRDLEETLESGN